MSEVISLEELARITSSPMLAEDYCVANGCNYLVVDMRIGDTGVAAKILPTCVILGLGQEENAQPAVDVIANDEATLAELVAAIDRQPVAAATLVTVLRHNENASVEQGLLAESLAYSTLQHSAGFKNWLAGYDRPATREDPEPPLSVERIAGQLRLTLNRPQTHNAYNAALKDALCEGLYLAHADNTIETVSLCGNGPSFSAGGDLSEFGRAHDAAVAHLSRTTRSAAALLSTLPCSSEAWLHGACIGAGIELPAFTQHITAHPDTVFQLPEVAMGLIPGAGGTVSVLRRVGRQRTAYLALSNQRIDANTALNWGLVDALGGELGLHHPA